MFICLIAAQHAALQVGKGLAAAIMDRVEPRIGMVAVLLLVAAFNSGFALGNTMPWFCFFWFTGRIVHVSDLT
jgi:sugar phosphate permease